MGLGDWLMASGDAKEARTNLLNLGFDKKQIKQEIYE